MKISAIRNFFIKASLFSAALTCAYGVNAQEAAAAGLPPSVITQLNRQMAPIRSQSDFAIYMKRNSVASQNPYYLLSKAAQQRFAENLVFGSKGLASFDYADIEAELTLSQAYRLLSLFGAQTSLAVLPSFKIETETDQLVDSWRSRITPDDDHDGYACSKRGECFQYITKLCNPAYCVGA